MMNCSMKKYISRHVIGRRYHHMLLQSYHHHNFYHNHHHYRNSSTYTLVEAIKIICSTRYTERKFSSKEVSLELMKNIIQVAQLAPSSFNLQPYKIVIVSSKEDKELLSSAMLGGNQKTVLDAPLSLVLLADTDPVIENLPKLVELERQHGKTLDSMEAFVSSVKLLYDNSIVTRKVKALATHLLSPLRPTPVVPSNNHTWAIKNCMLMAQQLMLVATAYGLSTGPMEGFDERRVSYVLGIPLQRYAIPLIINVGYSINSAEGESNDDLSSEYYRIAEIVPKKLRFPVLDICYLNKYGIKLK